MNVLILFLVIALIVAFPLFIIWALNTLFSLGLAYSFANWLAVLVLKVLVFSDKVVTSKK